MFVPHLLHTPFTCTRLPTTFFVTFFHLTLSPTFLHNSQFVPFYKNLLVFLLDSIPPVLHLPDFRFFLLQSSSPKQKSSAITSFNFFIIILPPIQHLSKNIQMILVVCLPYLLQHLAPFPHQYLVISIQER